MAETKAEKSLAVDGAAGDRLSIPPDTFGRLSDSEMDSESQSLPDTDAHPLITITVAFSGSKVPLSLPEDATLEDLVIACDEHWGSEYDWASSKMIPDRTPGVKPLLKPQGDDLATPLAPLAGKGVRIMASKVKDIASLRTAEQTALRHWSRRREALQRARAAASAGGVGGRRHSPRRTQEEATYTFLQLRPLPNMPHPERSLAFLKRLKADPGIRAAMRKHRFSVGLLTEMDPAAYTESNHEGTTRILGLNRNAGEVIELRLRTDAGDGYRDYGVIRKTLCHELAHNVHGPHDRNFWDLCHQIEREVQAADWKHGGRSVGNEEYYEPPSGVGCERGRTRRSWTTEAGPAASSSLVAAVGAAVPPGRDRGKARRSAEGRFLPEQREARQKRMERWEDKNRGPRGGQSGGGSSSRS